MGFLGICEHSRIVGEASRSIADRLNLPERYNPNADICQFVNNWLCDEMNGRWLLTLDNVDNIDIFFPQRKLEVTLTALAKYLPQIQHRSTLITSKNKDTALRFVGVLSNVMQIQAIEKSQSCS